MNIRPKCPHCGQKMRQPRAEAHSVLMLAQFTPGTILSAAKLLPLLPSLTKRQIYNTLGYLAYEGKIVRAKRGAYRRAQPGK